MCTDVVILAGGSGERLWPASTTLCPKQFMKIADGESFLQQAVRHAFSLSIEGEIVIISRNDWVELVIDDVLELSKSLGGNELLSRVLVFGEPYGKNTAPAIAWACTYFSQREANKNANVLLMASDHIISPSSAFITDVATASAHAQKGALVSFSITPLFPATGYGYIQAGIHLDKPFSEATDAFEVVAFREKPDAKTAQKYIDSNNFYWNSGLYVFTTDFYMAELAKFCPEIVLAFAGTGQKVTIQETRGVKVMTSFEGLDKAYKESPSISIDYAVSEKTEKSITVKASFLWDDVGSWDSLEKYYTKNSVTSVEVESENCFILSDIPVAVCGLNDIIVVIKDGKALVSKKGESNLVKDALAGLKKKGL